ncbi:MAG: VWA domain-containing protein, partial [Planctomycetota bacterium]
AKHELRKAIRNLEEDVHFNVIFYNAEYQVWAEEGLKRASAKNKRSAIEFVDDVEPEGGTNFFDSLERAFHTYDPPKKGPARDDGPLARMQGGADTIYMLSDGQPTSGSLRNTGAILKRVEEMNRDRNIIIHTILVGAEENPEFMRALAESNGGRFIHCRRPQPEKEEGEKKK